MSDFKSTPATAAKINTLTLAFAKAVGSRQSDKSDNLVVSAYNATTALAMVAQGAKGQTREEMAQTLFGVSGADLDREVSALTDLNTKILDANKDSVTLKTANGFWINDKVLDLNPDYAAKMKKDFGASISNENFSSPATAEKINKWAADNTNNMIDKIIGKTDANEAAIIASALYFKGDWTTKFDVANTQDRPFKNDAGQTASIPTMKQLFQAGSKAEYHEGDDYEAVALSYGENDAKTGKSPTMTLTLVRPKDASVSARDWLAAQASQQNPAWLDSANFYPERLRIELPKMDIKQSFDLIPALKDMGIKSAFGNADFSGLCAKGKGGMSISGVSHDIAFKTDEVGSEAAAVTTIRMTRSASMPQQPTVVKFDRSYAFVLQDKATGAVLFVGAVNNPQSNAPKAKVKELTR